MFEPDGRIARPPRPFALLIAVLLVGFFGLTGTLIWAASSGGSRGFMGGGRPRGAAPRPGRAGFHAHSLETGGLPYADRRASIAQLVERAIRNR